MSFMLLKRTNLFHLIILEDIKNSKYMYLGVTIVHDQRRAARYIKLGKFLKIKTYTNIISFLVRFLIETNYQK
jgi:hypothetical protein